MTDQLVVTLEEARTHAGVLFAGTDLTAQPGKSAHGVLAALLYAADLTIDGFTEILS